MQILMNRWLLRGAMLAIAVAAVVAGGARPLARAWERWERAQWHKQVLAAYNQMQGPVFKIDNDPRVTGFGKFLRRSSFDELPQLFNIIKGDMSLVGPRPLPIYEVEQFDSTAHRRRLSMKPGLTCLWQVQGRNQIKSFDEWVKLDLQYIDNWSLWLDLEILLKTIPVVILGFGAR